MKIVHLAKDHRPLDVRIFEKECRTLAKAGYDVHILVPDAPEGRTDGVNFVRVHVPAGRGVLPHIQAIVPYYRAARRLRADVYHVHEPTLIPAAILLKLLGAKVIYDAHEDTPRQMRAALARRPLLALIISSVFAAVESLARLMFDRFVCATPTIAANYPPKRTTLVRNMVQLPEARGEGLPQYNRRPNRVIYVGGINERRGLREMIGAIQRVPAGLRAELQLAGVFLTPSLQAEVESLSDDRIRFVGWQTRENLNALLDEARIGLLLFHPTPAHIVSGPNKLFEYMGAGIPLVASDFPTWREIISKENCGILVDPLDVDAIARAIQYLLENPEEAEMMGKRGKQAAEHRYSWKAESAKLLDMYHDLAQTFKKADA